MSRWTTPSLMGVFQAAGGLQDIVDRFGDGERPVLLDQGRKIAALDILHRPGSGRRWLRRRRRRRRYWDGLAWPPPQPRAESEPTAAAFFVTFVGSILMATTPLHAAMLGLEHLPHATGADLVEHRVVAEDQRLGSAGVDFLSLEFRQLFALDKLLGKLLGVLGMGFRAERNSPAFRRNNARVGQAA